jgi:hypothetical protein
VRRPAPGGDGAKANHEERASTHADQAYEHEAELTGHLDEHWHDACHHPRQLEPCLELGEGTASVRVGCVALHGRFERDAGDDGSEVDAAGQHHAAHDPARQRSADTDRRDEAE